MDDYQIFTVKRVEQLEPSLWTSRLNFKELNVPSDLVNNYKLEGAPTVSIISSQGNTVTLVISMVFKKK